jgi:hypothetical protein
MKIESPFTVQKTLCPKCRHKITIVNGVQACHVERKLIDMLTLNGKCECGCRWPL